jgi:K+ potassium transporter integral membrane domain
MTAASLLKCPYLRYLIKSNGTLFMSTTAKTGTVAQAGTARTWAPAALACMGVVFGDIGTSPLYTLNVAAKAASSAGQVPPQAVLGIVSLIFWSLIIVISIKYAILIMRADNHGEGELQTQAESEGGDIRLDFTSEGSIGGGDRRDRLISCSDHALRPAPFRACGGASSRLWHPDQEVHSWIPPAIGLPRTPVAPRRDYPRG